MNEYDSSDEISSIYLEPYRDVYGCQVIEEIYSFIAYMMVWTDEDSSLSEGIYGPIGI